MTFKIEVKQFGRCYRATLLDANDVAIYRSPSLRKWDAAINHVVGFLSKEWMEHRTRFYYAARDTN